MGSCQITKNQINLDLIEIIEFWTFGHFYLNHLSPLLGFFFQMKVNNLRIFIRNNLEITFKIMKKYLEIYFKKTGNIMEFCQSGKVGTCDILIP